MDLQKVELTEGTSIPFIWKDTTPGGGNLGRCEFSVQIKYKKAHVSEFFIYLFQHHNVKHFWHWKGGDVDFTIGSFDYLDIPKVWKIHYSQDIKGSCIDIYPPNDARFLYVDYHGINFARNSIGKVFDHKTGEIK